MKKINFIVPGTGGSFYYAVKYTIAWLDPSRFYTMISSRYVAGALNIRVSDMWREFMRPVKADVYWLDTPLYYNDIYRHVPLQRLRPRKIYVCSSWNLDMCRQYFNDCEVLPRLVHPLYLAYEPCESKEYDLGFVGVCWWRKGCDLFKRVCRELDLKCWATGSYSKLSMYELIDRLRRTRFLWWITLSEGFGLPLVEAQALGVVPICLHAHANLDYCFSCEYDESLCVKPIAEEIRSGAGLRHKVWIPRYEDVVHTVKHAISISREEYIRISMHVREKARALVFKALHKLINMLCCLEGGI